MAQIAGDYPEATLIFRVYSRTVLPYTSTTRTIKMQPLTSPYQEFHFRD